jgi:uncharacterized protein (UPF0332 family)
MIDTTAIDLSGYRLNKAKDLLRQSWVLLGDSSCDGSINRSYYAIFNAIRALLALCRIDSRKHSGVISYFDQYFVKTGIFNRTYSQIAHSAFEVRQMSDYQDFYMPSIDQAKQQFNNASQLIQEVENKRDLLLREEIPLPPVS